jgi:hypothetical protein
MFLVRISKITATKKINTCCVRIKKITHFWERTFSIFGNRRDAVLCRFHGESDSRQWEAFPCAPVSKILAPCSARLWNINAPCFIHILKIIVLLWELPENLSTITGSFFRLTLHRKYGTGIYSLGGITQLLLLFVSYACIK